MALTPLSLLLAGCGTSGLNNSEADANVSTRAEVSAIEGYRELRLGMPFEEAISAAGPNALGAYSISECTREMPIRGCVVHPDRDAGAVYEVRDGIPYHLDLAFNRLGRLTDIGLEYRRQGDVTAEQCLDIHARTLDWLVERYGAIRSSSGGEGGEFVEKTRTSPAGNGFRYGQRSTSEFITHPARTVSGIAAVREDTAITRWDSQRYASVLSSFLILVGRPECQVSVKFSEPESIERWQPSPQVQADLDRAARAATR